MGIALRKIEDNNIAKITSEISEVITQIQRNPWSSSLRRSMGAISSDEKSGVGVVMVVLLTDTTPGSGFELGCPLK